MILGRPPKFVLVGVPVLVVTVQAVLAAATVGSELMLLFLIANPAAYFAAVLPAALYGGLRVSRIVAWTALYATLGQLCQVLLLVASGVIAPCHGRDPNLLTQMGLFLPPALITAVLHGVLTRSLSVGVLTAVLSAGPLVGLGVLHASTQGVTSPIGDVVGMLGSPLSWFQAVLWTAAMSAVLVVWAWRHPVAKPGQCARCGYAIEGLAKDGPCPECGIALRS